MDPLNYDITTQRLLLTPFKASDLEVFHQINTDPYVRKYLWDDEVIPKELSQELLQKNQKHFLDEGYGLWKIIERQTNEIIGYTGLWYFFEEAQPQLLYALLETYSGQGMATEAAQSVIHYVFSTLKFDYLLAAMDKPHLPSQNVAKRLGMRFIQERLEDGKPTVFFRIDNALSQP